MYIGEYFIFVFRSSLLDVNDYGKMEKGSFEGFKDKEVYEIQHIKYQKLQSGDAQTASENHDETHLLKTGKSRIQKDEFNMRNQIMQKKMVVESKSELLFIQCQQHPNKKRIPTEHCEIEGNLDVSEVSCNESFTIRDEKQSEWAKSKQNLQDWLKNQVIKMKSEKYINPTVDCCKDMFSEKEFQLTEKSKTEVKSPSKETEEDKLACDEDCKTLKLGLGNSMQAKYMLDQKEALENTKSELKCEIMKTCEAADRLKRRSDRKNCNLKTNIEHKNLHIKENSVANNKNKTNKVSQQDVPQRNPKARLRLTASDLYNRYNKSHESQSGGQTKSSVVNMVKENKTVSDVKVQSVRAIPETVSLKNIIVKSKCSSVKTFAQMKLVGEPDKNHNLDAEETAEKSAKDKIRKADCNIKKVTEENMTDENESMQVKKASEPCLRLSTSSELCDLRLRRNCFSVDSVQTHGSLYGINLRSAIIEPHRMTDSLLGEFLGVERRDRPGIIQRRPLFGVSIS